MMDTNGPDAASFEEALAAATPTPGGGAAAARAGRLSTSLVRMVTGISLSKAPPTGERGAHADVWEDLENVQAEAVALAAEFDRLEGADIAAFEGFLAALRLPKGSEDEKAARRDAIDRATEEAIAVPLETLDASRRVLGLVERLLDAAAIVRLRAEADLGGTVELAHAAFRAAEFNIRVNLLGVRKESRRRELESRWRQEGDLAPAYSRLRDRVIALLEGEEA